jgi:hypothetical protein
VIPPETPDAWIKIERYMLGQIVEPEAGERPTFSFRPRGSHAAITVAVQAGQLENRPENHVGQQTIVQVRARQNARTWEVDRTSYQLIALRPYAPQIDEARLQRLFARGAKAWAGVADASNWVEELRGHTPTAPSPAA